VNKKENFKKFRLDSLIVKRGRRFVLNGLNLNIPQKEFFCIIGPSGAGKSTLIESILGTIPVKSGEIYINGKRIKYKF